MHLSVCRLLRTGEQFRLKFSGDHPGRHISETGPIGEKKFGTKFFAACRDPRSWDNQIFGYKFQFLAKGLWYLVLVPTST